MLKSLGLLLNTKTGELTMNNFMITCNYLFDVIGFTIGMTLLAVLFVWLWWNGYFNNCLKESVEDLKEGWPFYILVLVFCVIHVTLALIFG